MRPIDLSIPLGVGTPAWPTYEPLQVKDFKRLAPNGANGQIVTHSNHVGTHLDGEIHFSPPGKDISELSLDFLMADGVVVDLSDAVGEYHVLTPDKYQLMHLEMFPFGIVHAECVGGDVARAENQWLVDEANAQKR